MHAPSSRTAFAIRLSQLEAGGEYQVVYAEVVDIGLAHRVSFKLAHTLESVFAPKLADFIHGLLDGIGPERAVDGHVDAALDLGELLLRKVHLLIGRSAGGARWISLRFAQFAGQISQGFRVPHHFEEPLQPRLSQTSAQLCAQVVGPLADLAQFADHIGGPAAPGERVADRLAEVEAALREQLFRLRLLALFAKSPPAGARRSFPKNRGER